MISQLILLIAGASVGSAIDGQPGTSVTGAPAKSAHTMTSASTP